MLFYTYKIKLGLTQFVFKICYPTDEVSDIEFLLPVNKGHLPNLMSVIWKAKLKKTNYFQKR